jgi:hypothetical protein
MRRPTARGGARRWAALTAAVVAAGLLPALAPPAPASAVVRTAAAVAEPVPYVPVTGIPCYPEAGPRVHVFYLRATGQPDDVAERATAIRDAVAQADAVFAASAAKTGGTRHLRLRTGDACSLVITSVAVDKVDPVTTLDQVRKAGLLAAGDDVLAFAGPTLGTYSGDATLPKDTRPGADNLSNKGGQFAAIGFPFWGDVEGAASLLARTFGAVQLGAPHASSAGHCTDGQDPLCYDDLTIATPVTTECGPAHRYLLDCGGDDYFSTAPATGSWLATHWNVADSAFLARTDPPAVDAVESIGVELEGVPTDGRIGPQTPLSVRVTDSQAVTRIVLVSDRSPGVQPLTLSGARGTGALRSLESTGPGTLFALVTDKLGRERRSVVRDVTYVGGLTLSVGTAGAALRGAAVPYTVTLDPSGDQTGAAKFVVYSPATADRAAVVLGEQPYVAGTSTYPGTLDSTKLPDADDLQLVVVLADAIGIPVAGSHTPVNVTVSNNRPAVTLDVTSGQVLTRPTALTASVTEAVASVRFVHTTGACSAGRVVGTATAAPYGVSYDPASDWAGPRTRSWLCATAVLTDGRTTTVGPVRVTTNPPDSVELKVATGTKLTVGLNKLGVVVRAPSGRALRHIQLFETSPVFGKLGQLLVSTPVAEGTLPTDVQLLVPAGARGITSLFVRAVFADGEDEYVRSAVVPVEAVEGPAATISVSPSTIITGGQVLVKGTAPPGAELKVWVVQRPSTTYKVVRSGRVPLDGKYSAVLAPPVNGRVYVQVVGGRNTAALPMNVRSRVSMTPTRIGLRTYRFSGSIVPKRAGVTVVLARKTSTGVYALARATSVSDGRWSLTYRFPVRGTQTLLAVTVADVVNAQGSSLPRSLAVY